MSESANTLTTSPTGPGSARADPGSTSLAPRSARPSREPSIFSAWLVSIPTRRFWI